MTWWTTGETQGPGAGMIFAPTTGITAPMRMSDAESRSFIEHGDDAILRATASAR